MRSTLAFLLLVFVCCTGVCGHSDSLFERQKLEEHRRLVQRRSPAPNPLESIAKAKRASKASGKRCSIKKPPSLAASSTSTSKPKPSSTSSDGLINVKSNCGKIGATKQITATSGPNGALDWLDCGINDGGWRPPFVTVNDIITVDLPTALKSSSSPFKACSAYIDIFEKYGKQFGIPSIIIASFAMQESSCNPKTIGGGGEQGIMQISKDKCTGAPGGNCLDPDFNIRTGAKYFADTLKGNNGDLLLTIGGYNGWFAGMTFGQATAAAHSSCCLCQNNLDYLHQFLNGWVLNVDAYSHNPPLGKYFNLNVCH